MVSRLKKPLIKRMACHVLKSSFNFVNKVAKIRNKVYNKV